MRTMQLQCRKRFEMCIIKGYNYTSENFQLLCNDAYFAVIFPDRQACYQNCKLMDSVLT